MRTVRPQQVDPQQGLVGHRHHQLVVGRYQVRDGRGRLEVHLLLGEDGSRDATRRLGRQKGRSMLDMKSIPILELLCRLVKLYPNARNIKVWT